MAEGKAALDFIAVQCFQCNVRPPRNGGAACVRSLSEEFTRRARSPRLRACLTRRRLFLQTYQVQRGGKKSPKFACKVCGAKQSVQVVFARTAKAADARKAVQALNQGRADTEARADAAHLARAAAGFDGEDAEAPQAAPLHAHGGKSKWAAFLDEAEEFADAAEEDADARYVASFEAARAAKRRSSLDDEARDVPKLSKRAAPPPPQPAAYVAPAAGAQEAPEAQQRAPEPRLRWGGAAAPAPLSPRNVRVAAAAAPAAGAGGGKWAAFAGGGDEDDW